MPLTVPGRWCGRTESDAVAGLGEGQRESGADMTINTIMLVGLGFLVATLLAVIIAPAYRNRTMRLTADALRRSLPLSEAEIRAERDRMKAEHAILRIHNLETQLERVTLGSARQKIEVNRRDARISELEGTVNAQKSQLEELENAKRVLEQTVTDRLPKIELRLSDAKKLLQQRDGEVTTLAETAQRQARAISEATQINTQQGIELEQLKTALATSAARNQDTLADTRFDGEVALRTEIEALRAKSRDQGALIERLQSVIAHPASGAEPQVVEAVSGALGAASKSTLEANLAEFNRLRVEFAELKSAYALARAKFEAAESQASGAKINETELQKLKSENQDLTSTVARLTAALSSYETSDTTERGTKETPLAMKAKVSALEAQTKEQAATIQTLRAEVAAVNERLARQAAHYMDEMKKLGAGSVQTTSAPRPEPKRSLSDRITDPRVVKLTPLSDKRAGETAAPDEPADAKPARRLVNLFDAPNAQNTASAPSTPTAPGAPGAPSVSSPPAPPAAASLIPPAPVAEPSSAQKSAAIVQPAAVAEPAAKPRRPRLLERIASIDKTGE